MYTKIYWKLFSLIDSTSYFIVDSCQWIKTKCFWMLVTSCWLAVIFKWQLTGRVVPRPWCLWQHWLSGSTDSTLLWHSPGWSRDRSIWLVHLHRANSHQEQPPSSAIHGQLDKLYKSGWGKIDWIWVLLDLGFPIAHLNQPRLVGWTLLCWDHLAVQSSRCMEYSCSLANLVLPSTTIAPGLTDRPIVIKC